MKFEDFKKSNKKLFFNMLIVNIQKNLLQVCVPKPGNTDVWITYYFGIRNKSFKTIFCWAKEEKWVPVLFQRLNDRLS